jgi:hypothetical protein
VPRLQAREAGARAVEAQLQAFAHEGRVVGRSLCVLRS